MANSHQGISFIANNQKDKSKNIFESSKISSLNRISYIAPENKKDKKNKLSTMSECSESQQNKYTYIPPENLKNKNFQISSNKYQNRQSKMLLMVFFNIIQPI